MKTLFIAVIFTPFIFLSAAVKPHYVVNFGGNTDCPVKGWTNTGKYEEIYRWGRGRKLFLIGDLSPVADGTASFVSKFGSSVELSNLSQHSQYTLWIDFVKFRDVEKSDISSRLEIYADREKIAEFDVKKLPEDKYAAVDIPDEITFKGGCVITFREYSMNTGMWGVWDMIISEGSAFPDESAAASFDNPPPVKEAKQNILKKKNSAKKDIKKNVPAAEVRKKDDKPVEPPKIQEAGGEEKKPDAQKEQSGSRFKINEPLPPRDPDAPDIVE